MSLKSELGKIWLFVTNFSFIPDSVFNDKVGVVTASSEIIIFFIYWEKWNIGCRLLLYANNSFFLLFGIQL